MFALNSYVNFMLSFLKKKMNMNALNVYLRMHLSVDCFLNNETTINDRIKKITRMLQKVIKNFTL